PYQRKIARILTKIDNIIEKTESTIEKYKAIKQGMMHDLFTRGVDVKTGKLRTSYEDAPELYKETALGMIPKGWDIGVLNDYCMSFINGGTPSTKNSAYWQGNIPWITGADFLETFEIGLIRRKITYEAVKNSATHVIPKGNILLVTRTGVGKLAIAPTDIAISQDITGLILDSEITIVDYFYYYFQRLVEDFKKMNQGTSINGIIRDDLMNCPIHVPKTTEQTMVAAKLLRIDNRLKNEQQYLDKHKKLKQGLMQDLLTGKKEVTPDPEDFETMNNEYE
ncbi:MAG: restriction endonuclease subunit S, partial [Candidatus Marinimicrobia bacterium]|nr:restriction endonuclease subunit S [Candidatus Neomarinimicrobiota bacterium]